MLEILILAIVQGISEFIPVSSSSHLIITSEYLNFKRSNLALDVSLHIGSFFAVIFYFRFEILKFLDNKILFLKILVSSIPVMIAGFLLVKFDIVNQLRNLKVIGWTTLLFGIILYFSDRFETSKNLSKNFSYKSAMIIGFFQVLSLIPGVSRSGITISSARLLKFNRVDSAKISFLLSIPTLAIVSIYGLREIFLSENPEFSFTNFIAIIFSFIFSYLTIKYLLLFLKKFSLNIFVVYRIILGLIILLISYL